MPKVISSLFGEIDYTSEEVYTFENGLPGFSDKREFLLVHVKESPFTVLHSIAEDLYFFLMDPFTIFPDYEFTLPEYVIQRLGIEQREQVVCYSIVVLREPLSDSTVNMVAPVVLNTTGRTGMQVVLESTSYSVRQPVFVSGEEQRTTSQKDVIAK